MAGVAIAQAIEGHTEIDITLKWPNDILIDERKVGGILCESFKRSSTETCVVIGFGINVNLSESAFPKNLEQTATSLQTHSKHPSGSSSSTQIDHHDIRTGLESTYHTWPTSLPAGVQLALQHSWTTDSGSFSRRQQT